jgi:hypothetical protein
MAGIVCSVSVLLRCRPEDGSPSLLSPGLAGATKAALISRHRRSATHATLVVLRTVIFQKQVKGNAMNRSIALGLAMVAGTVIGVIAVNGLHAQNRAPRAYAVLDLRAISSPDVFKTLPSKTGDFDGHTA